MRASAEGGIQAPFVGASSITAEQRLFRTAGHGNLASRMPSFWRARPVDGTRSSGAAIMMRMSEVGRHRTPAKLLMLLNLRMGSRDEIPRLILIGWCPWWKFITTLPPTNMEMQKGPFQEESSLSAGVCALTC